MATAQSIGEIELIAVKISELKELLKMGKDLEGPQKAGGSSEPGKTAKELIRAEEKEKMAPR